MFSSIRAKINNSFEQYDKYGENRINALKGGYIFFVLCFVNMFCGFTNPYFNFFYLPLTALTAEMQGETIQSKYWLFFHVMVGAIVAVFLFNILIPYPLFFVGFVFFYSLVHYIIAIHLIKNIFIPIPIALSLAVYSLSYGEIYTDVYVAFNNAMVSFFALILIVGALILFPTYYYFKAWRRAYLLLLKQIVENLQCVQKNEKIEILVRGHITKLVKYSRMLPRRLPIFSILKTTLLVNDLRILSCVIDQKDIVLSEQESNNLIKNLNLLIQAIEEKSMCHVSDEMDKTLKKIIHSWNYICS